MLLYVLLLWVVGPYVIPFARKKPLPSRLPRQLEESVELLNKKSRTPYEYIVNARDLTLSVNHGGRFKAVGRVHLAFQRELSVLLRRRGFMHCTQLNHLMRILLAKSKFFSDDDIRLRTTVVNLFFHQYLQVRVAGQWYDVDLVGDWMGVPLGKHVWGFR